MIVRHNNNNYNNNTNLLISMTGKFHIHCLDCILVLSSSEKMLSMILHVNIIQ